MYVYIYKNVYIYICIHIHISYFCWHNQCFNLDVLIC